MGLEIIEGYSVEACNKSMNEAMGITTSLCKIIWGLMPRNSYRQNSPYG